jgi:hypothetical protein
MEKLSLALFGESFTYFRYSAPKHLTFDKLSIDGRFFIMIVNHSLSELEVWGETNQAAAMDQTVHTSLLARRSAQAGLFSV